MYIWIGPENGKCVQEEEAFSYACQQIVSEAQEERETAMQIFREAGDISEAADRLTEWFYSGNWIREEPFRDKRQGHRMRHYRQCTVRKIQQGIGTISDNRHHSPGDCSGRIRRINQPDRKGVLHREICSVFLSCLGGWEPLLPETFLYCREYWLREIRDGGKDTGGSQQACGGKYYCV